MLMKNAKISTQKNILRQQNVIFNQNILSSDFFNSKNTRKKNSFNLQIQKAHRKRRRK